MKGVRHMVARAQATFLITKFGIAFHSSMVANGNIIFFCIIYTYIIKYIRNILGNWIKVTAGGN